jgi:hypothetical protein
VAWLVQRRGAADAAHDAQGEWDRRFSSPYEVGANQRLSLHAQLFGRGTVTEPKHWEQLTAAETVILRSVPKSFALL